MWSQAYLWDEDEAVVSWVTSQMTEDGLLRADSVIEQNIAQLRQEANTEKVRNIGMTDSDTVCDNAPLYVHTYITLKLSPTLHILELFYSFYQNWMAHNHVYGFGSD